METELVDNREDQSVVAPTSRSSGDSNWSIPTRVIDEYRDRESRKII